MRKKDLTMTKKFNVAIAGATGAVGIEMIKTLEKRNFPVKTLKLLASKRSAGKTLTFKGTQIVVEELTKDSFEGIDIALFSAGGNISKEYAQAVVDAGAVMIDNSSAFRMDKDVPLVVPEVNPEAALQHKGIIANPNCSTIIMVVAVNPLHKAKKLKRLVAATYQATSGAGAPAMQELIDQSQELINGAKNVKSENFSQQIGFNIIPHIDDFTDNGYTKEELKMVNETRKILNDDSLNISCTCVRIPVLRAHSEALNLEFEEAITVAEARELITNAPGVELVDDVTNNVYPMPIDASDKYDVLVGRIRQDVSLKDNKALDIFISGDQLLKGAALNAVQIAEVLAK